MTVWKIRQCHVRQCLVACRTSKTRGKRGCQSSGATHNPHLNGISGHREYGPGQQLGLSTKHVFQAKYSTRARHTGKQHDPPHSRNHRLERSHTFSKQKRVRPQYSYKIVGHAENAAATQRRHTHYSNIEENIETSFMKQYMPNLLA